MVREGGEKKKKGNERETKVFVLGFDTRIWNTENEGGHVSVAHVALPVRSRDRA